MVHGVCSPDCWSYLGAVFLGAAEGGGYATAIPLLVSQLVRKGHAPRQEVGTDVDLDWKENAVIHHLTQGRVELDVLSCSTTFQQFHME